MTAVAEGQALKTTGQALAARALTPEHRALFRSLVVALPVGAQFSINDLRAQLDDANVPEAPRATLFAAAAREGLIEQVLFDDGDEEYSPKTRRSTGRSAHRARVNVWQRIAPQTPA
ncbi:hypothetical protein ACFWGN_17970 [Oerskovia sp. NPDC060338]|uniref:hypothetical protein n=1 Tax=Oerskovia sp. NPDC060338 TaxID=3347100 RepID=UPI00366828E8